jgi:hypothetical protein
MQPPTRSATSDKSLTFSPPRPYNEKRGHFNIEVSPVSFILVSLLLHENLLHAIALLHDDDAAFGLLQTHT